MVRKNTYRTDYGDTYYHVYNRGIDGMELFRDEDDHRYFEYLIMRCLSPKPLKDSFGREYRNFYGLVRLHAYCLMPNHYHLLVWQKESGLISKFISAVCIPYGMYFNKKYKRQGTIFESKYKAVRVETDPQLMHVSRYIHLNPVGYRLWDHSSYSDYVYSPRDWVTTDFVLGLFPSKKAYLDFVDDYEDVKRANDKYKHEIGQ
ncbi:MAG: transposase [Candidatus Nomurabacteria bacterium]|jgi:putative transposase|nr:transposase [Candidatus Nomurabacteria bacterium]